MRIDRVSYGTTTIPQLRRVALDQNLLNTLDLRVGDSVRVELDVALGAVLITKVLRQPMVPTVSQPNVRGKRATQ